MNYIAIAASGIVAVIIMSVLASAASTIKDRYKAIAPTLMLVLLSLLITVVMIVLNVVIKPSESGINTVGIITSFIAGMSGYATLEFLRQGYLKS